MLQKTSSPLNPCQKANSRTNVFSNYSYTIQGTFYIGAGLLPTTAGRRWRSDVFLKTRMVMANFLIVARFGQDKYSSLRYAL